MAHSRKNVPRRGSAISFLAIGKLARWQLRQAWRLLFIVGIGILIAVVLICAVPLYSQIVISAGVRDALVAAPEGPYVTVHSSSFQIVASAIRNIQQQLTQEMQAKLGSYVKSKPQFSLQEQGLTILKYAPGSHVLIPQGDQMELIGATIPEAASHLTLLKGRLPRPNSTELEIAVVPEIAADLNLSIGSTIPVQALSGSVPASQADSKNIVVRIVGIFKLPATPDPYWHLEDFQRPPSIGTSIDKALVSNDALLSLLEQEAHLPAFSRGLSYSMSPDLFWYYQLDVSRIDANKLDDLVSRVSRVLTDISGGPSEIPYVYDTQSIGPLTALQAYRNYISVIRIPAISLTILLLGLVLYFVSVMTDVLVDRKAEAVAILRSRGANRRQIFAVFVSQGVGLGVLSLALGPPLAVVLVRYFVQQTLPASDQQALNLLVLEPMQVLLGLLQSALIAVVVAISAMIISIYRATRFDILSMRRDSARSQSRVLWQRLGLDVIAAIIALVGYIFSIYLTSPGVLSARVHVLVVAPLTIAGIVFLLLGATLLFLRGFPLLLRLCAWLAGRSRSASALLALAQMARTPRQSLRTTMLLAMATAFTLFALVFNASQAQRIADVAAFQVGADFSGKIFGSAMVAQSATYSHLPGIASATVGYDAAEHAAQNGANISVELRAVDAATYAQTAIWTATDSSQPLSELMKQLIAHRSATNSVVAAIVDASAWNALHLSTGSPFTINDLNGSISCIAIAEVQHIPTIIDSNEANDTGDYIPSGGILVDYPIYAAASLKDNNYFIPTTDVWLRIASDPASLATARNQLTNGPYHLDSYSDRRAIIDSLSKDPLYIALLGMLLIGAITALFLALLGNLIVSWQNARNRLTNFAVLRALGSSRQQLANILLWEQSIVYSTSLILGLLFGVLLATLALPTMVFTSANGTVQLSTGQFYVLQGVPPVQVVIPLTLWITLGLLILICLVALRMMVSIVSRPSISQTLRLNED